MNSGEGVVVLRERLLPRREQVSRAPEGSRRRPPAGVDPETDPAGVENSFPEGSVALEPEGAGAMVFERRVRGGGL